MKLKFEQAKAMMPKLQTELRKKTIEFLQEDCGYDEKGARDWSRVDMEVKQDSNSYGDYTGLYFEVGAELGYEDMYKLEDQLNPIVQKIDPEAFFELYDPGITTCYIWYENSEIESCNKIPVETNSKVCGSNEGLWSVYSKNDSSKSGKRFATEEEAYEYRDEMGEDYEVTFMPGEEFAENAEENTSVVDLCEDITSAELPDYGGAFDIDPHEFFTKEECMELAQEVEDILNKDPDVPYPVQYYDVYIVDYNRIVVDLTDSQDNELSGQAKIDMRRIRVPHDLITKYGPIVADSVKEDIAYIYSDEIESSINLDNYDDGYVEMRDGEPNFVYNNLRDAQNGVAQSRAGDVEYGMGSHDYKIMRWKDKQLQDVEESEDIENPMVIGDYYDDDNWEEADDVSGEITILFTDYIEVDESGDWSWIDDMQDSSDYTNEFGDPEWVDEETNITILSDEGEAGELIDDIMNEGLYTRLSNVPGRYKIKGEIVVPYKLTDLYGYTDEDDRWVYDDQGYVELKKNRYKVEEFVTKRIK